MGCDPNNAEINVNPSFYTNRLGPLQNWGEAKSRTQKSETRFSLILHWAAEPPPHRTFSMVGHLRHLSRREKPLLVWTNGYCDRAVASVSIGKAALKLGRLSGNQPESNPSGHIRLRLT